MDRWTWGQQALGGAVHPQPVLTCWSWCTDLFGVRRGMSPSLRVLSPSGAPPHRGDMNAPSLLALTRVRQHDQHVLSQAHRVEELLELLQELWAHVLIPCCKWRPKWEL